MNMTIILANLSQIGLVLGFAGAILLAFSQAVGNIYKYKDGSEVIDFGDQDPLAKPELKIKRVRSSHWRKRYFTPLGWGMLVVSFFLQLLATIS